MEVKLLPSRGSPLLPTELVRALSIQQPWAGLIAAGRKHVEIRGRRTSYRGELSIHASLGRTFAAVPDAPCLAGVEDTLTGTTGALIARTVLADCRPASPSDRVEACWEPPVGSWAWVLGDVKVLPAFLPARGYPMLFSVVVPEVIARPHDLAVLRRSLPDPYASWDMELEEFALTFDGYRHVDGGPEALEANMLLPAIEAVRKNGGLPERLSIGDLRATLFAISQTDSMSLRHDIDVVELPRLVLERLQLLSEQVGGGGG